MVKVIEKATDLVAAGAVVSPIWLPYLESVSQITSLLLPVAGLTWLCIQIVGYFFKKDE